MNATVSLLAQQNQSSGGSLIIFLPVLALLVYMMIVPQRKQKKKQQELMASLTVGDEVLTSGGIYGTINFLEGDVAHLQVDTDVVIRVSKGSLTRRSIPADDPDDAGSDATSDDDTGTTKAQKPPKA